MLPAVSYSYCGFDFGFGVFVCFPCVFIYWLIGQLAASLCHLLLQGSSNNNNNKNEADVDADFDSDDTC